MASQEIGEISDEISQYLNGVARKYSTTDTRSAELNNLRVNFFIDEFIILIRAFPIVARSPLRLRILLSKVYDTFDILFVSYRQTETTSRVAKKFNNITFIKFLTD